MLLGDAGQKRRADPYPFGRSPRDEQRENPEKEQMLLHKRVRLSEDKKLGSADKAEGQRVQDPINPQRGLHKAAKDDILPLGP